MCVLDTFAYRVNLEAAIWWEGARRACPGGECSVSASALVVYEKRGGVYGMSTPLRREVEVPWSGASFREKAQPRHVRALEA